MSDLPPTPPTPPIPPDPGASGVPHSNAGDGAAGRARVRPTSVELRGEDAHEHSDAALMDPAAKSLADALRITYRLLLVAMVILLALFVFSGVQSVNQGERAIRLRFGRVTNADLGPGFHMSLPHPFGELVKVQTTAPTLTIDDAFWPALHDSEKNLSPAELAGGGKDSLNPVDDGSLVTGDGGIVHVKCQVKYRRDDPALALQTFDPEAETAIVRAAVRRGIVRAGATMTVDQILANLGIELRAQAIAQEMLETMKCGLRIEQLIISSSMPPRHVAKTYYIPQTNLSEAQKLESEARAYREQKHKETAGAAAPAVLAQIERYDEQLRLGDAEGAHSTQETIFKLLSGEAVTIDGQEVKLEVYGQVSQLLAQARTEATRTVSTARSDAMRLAAVRDSFATNPSVTLNREWTDAYAAFLKREQVQVQVLQPGMERIVMMINRDPNLSKEQFEAMLRKRNEAIAADARAKRAREAMERRVDPSAATSATSR